MLLQHIPWTEGWLSATQAAADAWPAPTAMPACAEARAARSLMPSPQYMHVSPSPYTTHSVTSKVKGQRSTCMLVSAPTSHISLCDFRRQGSLQHMQVRPGLCIRQTLCFLDGHSITCLSVPAPKAHITHSVTSKDKGHCSTCMVDPDPAPHMTHSLLS